MTYGESNGHVTDDDSRDLKLPERSNYWPPIEDAQYLHSRKQRWRCYSATNANY